MISKINKINSILRSIILVIAAVCVIFKLADKKISQPKQKAEGFQTHEFDDIW